MDDDTLTFPMPSIAPTTTAPASSFEGRLLLFFIFVGCFVCYCYFCHRIDQNSSRYPNINQGNGSNGNGAGLDKITIKSYPKLKYKKDGMGDDDNNDALCSVCLCEYKESERLRMMPECRHYFHVSCLDKWLRLNGSCPVCRNKPTQQA